MSESYLRFTQHAVIIAVAAEHTVSYLKTTLKRVTVSIQLFFCSLLEVNIVAVVTIMLYIHKLAKKIT